MNKNYLPAGQHLTPTAKKSPGSYIRAVLALLLMAVTAAAQPVPFNGSAYTQNFQSMTASSLLPATVSGTTMLQVSAQSGGGSVTGWYLYHQAGTSPRWGRTDGSSSTGSFFALFDAQATPNRALGSQGSNNAVQYWGVVLQNTSANTITSVNISYDAVMNRNPSTTVNPFPMSYRTSATTVAASSSTGSGTFNDAAGTWLAATGFVTPSSGTGAPGTQNAISPLFRIGGATITQTLSGMNWQPNQYLYIRWKETDDQSSDATAGVDNFSISTVACQPPTIVAPAAVSVNTNAACSATGVSLGTPVTTAPCGLVSVTNNAPASFPLGATTVTWTVTDASGNTATATQTVTVTDNVSPQITAPAAVATNANEGCTATGISLGTPVTSDNCGVANVTSDAPAVFPVGITTVTWTVTDVSGNTGTATQTVTVTDTIAPQITAPADVVITSNDGCTATGVSLGTPVTSDNCTVATVTNNAPASFPAGITTVIWTVTDSSGNSATATQTVTVSDATLPTITAPPAITVAGTDGCSAAGIQLGVPVTADNCAVASVTNNAPASFPLGTTVITWTVTDGNGNTATATQNVIVTDTSKPAIYLQATKVSVPGITGPSSSQSPYLKPFLPGTKFTSIFTTGDAVGGYKMAGIPDGLGAFDNGNGTFTLLMNHEILNTLGVVRAHGSKGSFVSKWTINKSDLSVVSGSDLMQQVYLWDTTTQTYVPGTFAFSRFCSADLPPLSAFYNTATGKGTTERIYMNGEESGVEGKAMGHIVTGPDAGKSYELPYLGKFAWENSVASPATGDKTVVAGMDDGTGGQVYFYIGTKTTTGTDINKAGLSNGKLYGVKVAGLTTEVSAGTPAPGTRFDLADLGFVQNKTGDKLNTESVAAGVTTFLRPEDGAWDPSSPADFYFATTNAFGAATPTRLWRLRFDNINSPELGGTIEAVLNGTEAGQQMFDNIGIDKKGHITLVEDVGNNVHIGKVWQYNIANDSLFKIGYHDSTRFISGGANFLTQDEESSGIIDVSDILGQGMYLVDVQAHFGSTTELVEGGQLLAMYNPYVFGTSTAPDTVKVTVPFGATSASNVSLGTPATSDNCSVAAVSNNAPSSFPLGNSIVTWTVTDGSGNSSSVDQVVVVTAGANMAPVVSITSPMAPATFTAGGSVTINVSATDADGSVSKVELLSNGVLFATDSVAPFSFDGTNVESGVYKVVARATDNAGAITNSDTLTVTFTGCTPVGNITGEGYTNIPGTQVSDLTASPTYPNNPNINALLNTFEYANVGNNYGARVRGYICAPLTGTYTFYIASDEQAGLWLSTDENPANKVLIAYNEVSVGFRAYNTFATQHSVLINLVKGARYYIETLHKQGPGADHLSVGWILPNGTQEFPIAGNRLSPVTSGASNRVAQDFAVAMKTANAGTANNGSLKGLTVTVAPNPSSTFFSIVTTSNVETPISLTLVDVLGRVLEKREHISANGTVRIGSNLKAGIYYVQVTQGNQREKVKLVKQ